MELCSVLCGSLNRRGVWGRMNTCIHTAESLCCPPETITTLNLYTHYTRFPWQLSCKESHLQMQEIQVLSLGQEDPLEKQMATYFSTLAWKIPWTEEPSRLQSMGSQRVAYN